MTAGNLQISRSFIFLTLIAAFFNYGECTITGWSKPVIATGNGGNGALVETIDDGLTTGGTTGITITATVDSGAVNTYTKTSQSPSDVVFAIDNSGVVTITSGTITYSTTPVYTLVITANDGAAASATVTLSVNDKPAFGATNYGKSIADKASVGTTLTTVTASDSVNSGSLTYSIASGNTNTDFSISNTGMIKTLNAMDAATTGGYQLVVEAEDASLTGTTTVWVVVGSLCSGATALLAGTLALFMALTAFVLQ